MRILPAVLLAASAAVALSGCDAVLAVYKLTAERVHADAERVPTAAVEPADPRYGAAAHAVRGLARVLVAESNLPGLSVAVGVDGAVVWAEGLGWAHIAQRKPATPRTRYRIGTTSKVFTAAAVGVLVERGSLDLDAPVQAYLPRLAHAGISTRQAMAHTAGFMHFPLNDHFEPVAQCDDMEAAVDRLARYRPQFQPGSRWSYSSLGWVVVSAVVESIAGQPFHRFVQREVLAPLGLEATVPDDFHHPHPEQAGIYWPRAAMDTSYGLEHPGIGNYSCFPGAVDYLSTPSELVRFGLAMDQHQLLQAATTQLLHTPVNLPSGRTAPHGLGWQVETVALHGGTTPRIGHPGEAVGGTTVFHRYPEHGLVVAVSTNVTFVELEPFASRVAELFAAAMPR